MPAAESGFGESLAVLSIRDYRYFLLSRFFATLATQMQALVVSWQVYQRTKDPLALGFIGLVEAVMFIGFALWGGHVADRNDKRALILRTQWVILACAGVFAMLSLRTTASVLWIYVVVAVTGVARSFMWPASMAYSELTVPREIYSRAAAWNSTGWEIGSILGPALGGIVYAWKGPVPAYGIVVLLLMAAIMFSCLMGKRPPVSLGLCESGKDLLSGIRFVFSNQIILAALSLDMFAVLFGGVYAILPIYADLLKVGPTGLGWLRAAPSVGAIVMAV